jgi:hypothetical protein
LLELPVGILNLLSFSLSSFNHDLLLAFLGFKLPEEISSLLLLFHIFAVKSFMLFFDLFGSSLLLVQVPLVFVILFPRVLLNTHAVPFLLLELLSNHLEGSLIRS